MLKLLTLTWLILICSWGISQKYSFSKFSTEQGLPQSQVTSFDQDADGYLWVGTLGGLARFNGNKFATYSVSDGLLNNRIQYLAFIKNKLWIGHDGGISIISNKKIEKFSFSGNDRSRSVSQIVEFNERLFVCSNGGGFFEFRNNELIKIPISFDGSERIRGACEYNGKLYLASKGGVLVTKDGSSFELMDDLGELSFSGISKRGENELVFTTYTDGIFFRNMETGEIRSISSELIRHPVTGVYIDSKKKIWLKTFHGIVNISLNNEVSFLDNSNGLPVNSISCFFEDQDNTIWIGSQGKGIFSFPSEQLKYFDRSTGLPSDLYVSGFQSTSGDFYLGSYDSGIIKKQKDGTIEQINAGGSRVWCSMHDVEDSDWFGTDVSLVQIQHTGSIKQYVYGEDKVPGTKITALYKINESSFYIGGNRGAAKYDNGTFEILAEGQDVGTVRDFEVVEDELYCATNLGLMVYRNGKFEVVPGGDQLVYNIEQDHEQGVWFGSEEGLFRIINDKVEKVELLNDPGSNFIAFINYHNNEMFVGTNNGLFVLSELEKKQPTIERFGIYEGIIDLETNLNSGFFDLAGDFWFGTASALVCYHRKIKSDKRVIPRVNIVSVLVNYDAFDYNRYSSRVNNKGLPIDLVLPYSKNNLIFNLDGISLGQYGGLNYQYKLVGQRDEWSIPSKSNSVSFNNLAPGEYVLYVRCSDNDGTFSDEIVFPITIKNAFYQTWWFITLVITFVAGLLWFIFKMRIQRIDRINRQEKIEYKSKLLELEQKSMNASMNRHFVFNSLNSIQYFINTQDRVSANKYLSNFAKLIRKNLDSATAVNNIISLEDELERIQLYLSLESMRFKGRFNYHIDAGNIDVESINIPAMIMQPFVENSIIHGILVEESKKGEINITLTVVGDLLHIRIADNGIGISKSLAKKENNVGDHRSQGMEITSKRIEILQKISENGISLDGPKDIIGDDGSINGTVVLIKIPYKDLDN